MPVSPAARRLAELPADACRWPSDHDLVDDRFTWCGRPAERGDAYCLEHHQASLLIFAHLGEVERLHQAGDHRAGVALRSALTGWLEDRRSNAGHPWRMHQR